MDCGCMPSMVGSSLSFPSLWRGVGGGAFCFRGVLLTTSWNRRRRSTECFAVNALSTHSEAPPCQSRKTPNLRFPSALPLSRTRLKRLPVRAARRRFRHCRQLRHSNQNPTSTSHRRQLSLGPARRRQGLLPRLLQKGVQVLEEQTPSDFFREKYRQIRHDLLFVSQCYDDVAGR